MGNVAGIVRHLVENPAFVGIGPASARRLADRFGEDLPRVLANGDVSALAEVLDEERAVTLVAAWRLRLAEGDVVVWLDEQGIGPRQAARIVALWGEEAPARLRTRPYDLLAVMDWQVVDRVGRGLGVQPDAPERLVAAVEAVLYGRLVEQDTVTPRPRLVAAVEDLLGIPVGERAIALAVEEGAAFEVPDGYQPAGAHMMETYVADRIGDLLADRGVRDLLTSRTTDEQIRTWLDARERAGGTVLDPEQRDAVVMGVRAPVGILVGGAGVGKTTVLRTMCDACAAFGRSVHLVALAGRAAVRMSEATGRPAHTIAAFLAAEHTAASLGANALVVVDESSMVDLPNLYRLMMRMGEGCRLLLVGDNAQLPPIGFGLVLHQLVDVPGIPLVRLVRIHRQAAETGIPVVAGEIRAGRLPKMGEALEGKGSGVVFLPGSGPNRSPTLQDVVDAVSTCGGWSEDIRILCPTKRSEAGTESVNAHFHSLLRHGRIRMSDPDYAVGEPVMFLRNDYRMGLRNGSLGTVTEILEDGLEAEFDGIRHELTGAKLEDLTLAYGITIHKAQGSAFSRVVIPIAPSRLLDRSLIYTAVTRARDQVVLIGDIEAFERAVTSSANAHRRIVGLRAAFEASSTRRRHQSPF